MNIIAEKPNPLGPYERTYPDMHPGFMFAATSLDERDALERKLGDLVSLAANLGGLEDPIADGLLACIDNHEITPDFVQPFGDLLFVGEERQEGTSSPNATSPGFTFTTSAGLVGRLDRSGCVEPAFWPVGYEERGRVHRKVRQQYGVTDFVPQVELIWERTRHGRRTMPQLLSERQHILFGNLRGHDFEPFMTQLAGEHPVRA